MPFYAMKTEKVQMHDCDRWCSDVNKAGATAYREVRRKVCIMDAGQAEMRSSDRTGTAQLHALLG